MTTTKLYNELSSWWPLMSRPEDYVEEAQFYARQLLGTGEQPARSMLELGSGGGNNASHMKAQFDLTLVEPSKGMLAHSRLLNPECEHLQGDMRDVRLGRVFDRVFVHDAISYMTTKRDLRKAIETAYVHCRRGGAALFAPDHLLETFEPSEDHGGYDASDGQRAMRWLQWTYDPDPSDCTVVVDYAYLLREADATTRVEHDRHIEGLFSRTEWLELLSHVGFQARSVPFNHSELEPGAYEVFVCVRP